jgi:hypothetical protein
MGLGVGRSTALRPWLWSVAAPRLGTAKLRLTVAPSYRRASLEHRYARVPGSYLLFAVMRVRDRMGQQTVDSAGRSDRRDSRARVTLTVGMGRISRKGQGITPGAQSDGTRTGQAAQGKTGGSEREGEGEREEADIADLRFANADWRATAMCGRRQQSAAHSVRPSAHYEGQGSQWAFAGSSSSLVAGPSQPQAAPPSTAPRT